jgi:hypothetical protein
VLSLSKSPSVVTRRLEGRACGVVVESRSAVGWWLVSRRTVGWRVSRWEEEDSNLRRLRRRFYRPLPLATRASSREPDEDSNRKARPQEIRLHGAKVKTSRFRSRQWPTGWLKVTFPARSRHETDWYAGQMAPNPSTCDP